MTQTYCKLAKALYKRDIECGLSDCPLAKECPKLIWEDAGDSASEATEEMIIGLIKMMGESK